MLAELVYDGQTLNRPSRWKMPRADQLTGTISENLVELAGRGCYDSLGTGRASVEYHQHLLSSKHFSVHEHVHMTVVVPDSTPAIMWVGVPDVFLYHDASDHAFRFTFNLRHVLEWPKTIHYIDIGSKEERYWRNGLFWTAHQLCPQLIPNHYEKPSTWNVVDPIFPEEKFVTLFLEGSRVFSHEMVRHRFNMSQRSGRFCDETDRDYSIHPLFREYLNEAGYLALNEDEGAHLFREPVVNDAAVFARTRLGNDVGSLIAQSRMVYDTVCTSLQTWLMDTKKLDAATARKQARSAARHYLGNGLSTEMLFTASIASWDHIFHMRCNPAADAEIQEIMNAARECVNKSWYGVIR